VWFGVPLTGVVPALNAGAGLDGHESGQQSEMEHSNTIQDEKR